MKMACDQQPKIFNYTSLDQENHEIRIILVRNGDFNDPIVCEMEHVSFNRSPSYEALSYTRGEPCERKQLDLINLDQACFGVTRNLSLALRHLRLKNNTRCLWVDAICINQDDTEERNNQVRQMARIYRDAQHVHLWLGPANDVSIRAMRFLKTINAQVLECMKNTCKADKENEELQALYQKIKAAHIDPLNAPVWTAICRLWQRNYWTRIWIIQEVVFGTTRRGQCLVHCGTDSIAWETLAVLDYALSLLDSPHGCYDNEHSAVDVEQLSAGARLDLSWFIGTKGALCREGQGLALSYLLIRQGRYRATDPRDKVYALSSLASPAPQHIGGGRKGLEVNYDLSTAQVYRMAMREIVLRERRLGVLCACSRECRNRETRLCDEALPSWCPDFSTDPMDRCCPARLWSYTKPIYYASGHEDANEAYFLPRESNDREGQKSEPPLELVAQGWLLDTVVLHSAETDISESGFLSLSCLLFLAQGIGGKFPRELSHITSKAHKVIWWTLVANRGHAHDEAPDSFGEDYTSLRTQIFGSTNSKKLSSVRDSSADLTNCNTNSNTATPFKVKMDTCLRKRRVCKSKTRFLPGLVPDTAKDGDVICILVGCALPLVLRKIDGRYSVVGESYIHGFMCGEILKMEKRGEIQREDFVIV